MYSLRGILLSWRDFVCWAFLPVTDAYLQRFYKDYFVDSDSEDYGILIPAEDVHGRPVNSIYFGRDRKSLAGIPLIYKYTKCHTQVYHAQLHTTNIFQFTNTFIVTTIGEACVCVCAKFDQFLPVRPHFDTKRPVNFFHIATFPSPTFGPLFAFHCPLFFTKNNNLHAAMF